MFGILLVCLANAQPKYQFDHWTTDNGLPQNAVNSILQTRDGYLWLATSDGLARFDGLQFKIFNKSNTKGIGSNRFSLLFEDRHGALWAVTDEDWLVKYQAGMFRTYTPRDGLPVGIVKQIEEDESGNLQIVFGKWLAQWKDGRFISIAVDDLWPVLIGARLVEANRLVMFGAGRLYWYSRGRLTIYDLKMRSFNFRSAYEDQYGTRWINTKDARLMRVREGSVDVHALKRPLQIPGPIQQDRKGNLWLSGDYSWLGCYRNNRLSSYTVSDGFLVSAIASFYEDREGNFWIGTSGGLYRAREPAATVYTRRDGLTSDGVYSICENRAGQLWFGTWGGGLTKYQNGKFTAFPLHNGRDAKFVTALYDDRNGNLWVGNMSGLCWFDQNQTSNPYQKNKPKTLTDPDGFFRHGVWAIAQDQRGRFWFGTSSGLIRYEAGRYTHYTTAEGLAGDDVKAILETRDGQLWIGTWGGLSRYADGKFVSYNERDGLASDHIRTLYEDAEGILWIGTYDGGLNRFKDGRLVRYTVNDGLFNSGVFKILEDERGYFWMSSNKGIYRVKRQELNDFADGKIRSITSVAFGKQDGMLNVECNGGRQPAGWKTRDGRLWFPTAQGAVVIDPSRVEINQQPPPVVIEEFRLNNEATPLRETIVIPPEKNENIEIRYQGLSFIRSEQQRFKYRLSDVDHDWIEVGSRRAAYYNRLPPGEYTFTALAANSEGIWNLQGASLRLKVLPSFWQTWLFKIGVLAGIFALGLAVIRRRIVRRRRELAIRDAHARQLIDAQERDRKRIAVDLHDSPAQLINLIRHYALDGLDEPDDDDRVTQRFAKIASFAEEAVEEMRQVAYNLRPPELDRLGLTRAIEVLVERFNHLSAIEFTCDLEPIDLAVEDEGKAHLYRIVQESLNNVVQHSHATKASLVVRREVNSVRIEIRDNGRGFVPNAHFDGKRAGLGLTGIAERARLLGGKAELNTAPGTGTTIVVILPEVKS